MHRRFVLLVVTLIFFALGLILSGVFAENNSTGSVGVKPGDWIKYNVKVTGNPISEYKITWARMDITAVQGPVITVNVLTQYDNGTLLPENDINLNVATGAIGDGFFVPTDLRPGDRYSTEYEGIINITAVENGQTGGATRSVLVGVTSQSVYNWDKQTGIMVSATSDLPGCIMYTTTSATNLWQTQILGVNQTLFYSLIATVIAVILIVVVVLTILSRARKKSSVSPKT